jgi:hypothetical protein
VSRIATTDPNDHVVRVSSGVLPPLLDRVILHEVAHAVTMSNGLLAPIHATVPERLWVPVEEWAVQLVENHGMEAVALASEALGRPVCVRGLCSDRLK